MKTKKKPLSEIDQLKMAVAKYIKSKMKTKESARAYIEELEKKIGYHRHA